MSSADGLLDPSCRDQLLWVARSAVEGGVGSQQPIAVDEADYAPPLRAPTASFATLRRRGVLRGCIGNLEPSRPLVCDVALNAFRAAFRDPRFPRVEAGELAELEIQISVLGQLELLEVDSEQQLLAALRPSRDGLVLRAGAREATFLPSVWESLGDRRDFVRELKRKAGLPIDGWERETVAHRYEVQSFSEGSPG